MSGIRLFFGVPLAVLITAGLFIVMHALISNDIELAEQRKFERWNYSVKPEPLDKPDRQTPDIDVDISTPPPPVDVFPKGGDKSLPGPRGLPSDIEAPGIEGDDIFPAILAPIIRIEPFYPDRCLARGLEGSVLVEFDITPDGAVVNPRILSTSSKCFNKSVLQAVVRWRYSPPGKLVRGQKTTLSFRLAN